MDTIRAIIFDLDGVICFTDNYHYQAWKELADAEGIYFDEKINGRLRGVSRMESLDIILERASRCYTQEEKEQLANMLKIAPRLKKAYVLKELFYKVMDSKTEEQFNKRLSKWFMLVESYNIDKFLTMAQSVRKWIHPIRRAVLTGYTNGYTEGCNNRTKVLKRICFGVRNFNRFRNRLLFIANYEKKSRIIYPCFPFVIIV